MKKIKQYQLLGFNFILIPSLQEKFDGSLSDCSALSAKLSQVRSSQIVFRSGQGSQVTSGLLQFDQSQVELTAFLEIVTLEATGAFLEDKLYELSYYLEPREGKEKGERPKLLEQFKQDETHKKRGGSSSPAMVRV